MNENPTFDLVEILDREERIFSSLRTAIELMGSSPCQEVREAHELLNFITEEHDFAWLELRSTLS